ncbi:hypothetical protein GCM10023322_18780 [Rugosimonospora acidiphila]|uniref:Uncharacterized protein n=1 Tax=Rugosimonospora acidiphila TaxID=556531 RepID=A0ABP9RQ82_9ACTN
MRDPVAPGTAQAGVAQSHVQGQQHQQGLERPVAPPAQARHRPESAADPEEDLVEQFDGGEQSQAGEDDEGELDHGVVHECDATEPVAAARGG